MAGINVYPSVKAEHYSTFLVCWKDGLALRLGEKNWHSMAERRAEMAQAENAKPKQPFRNKGRPWPRGYASK